MRRRAALVAFWLSSVLVLAGTGLAAFSPGPVRGGAKETAGKPEASATVREMTSGAMPAALLEAAKEIAASGGNMLIVGRADSFGPKSLNASLGMQYAVMAANRLGAALKIDLSRFECVSAGEAQPGVESGIALYRAEPGAPPTVSAPATVMVLGPAPAGEITKDFWAIWENDAKSVFWGRDGVEGSTLWRILTPVIPFNMPYPAATSRIALGADFGDDEGVAESSWEAVKPDPALTMSVESLETGWAVISGRAPAGSRNVHVWAGGIPYPAVVEGGRFTVQVVRYGRSMEAYAQATDSKGKVIIGPAMKVPPNLESDPKMIAVLTWAGSDADLDLHGWRGAGHTQPQDPDPAMSDTAARGVKLLFDGDGRSPASALWIEDAADIELEASVYSDFGGGATAMLYVVTDPGDPAMRRGVIIGPRVLTGDGMWSRWPAFRTKGRK